MMDKQVENLGIKCIEMTFALYNSDICTKVAVKSHETIGPREPIICAMAL